MSGELFHSTEWNRVRSRLVWVNNDAEFAPGTGWVAIPDILPKVLHGAADSFKQRLSFYFGAVLDPGNVAVADPAERHEASLASSRFVLLAGDS